MSNILFSSKISYGQWLKFDCLLCLAQNSRNYLVPVSCLGRKRRPTCRNTNWMGYAKKHLLLENCHSSIVFA